MCLAPTTMKRITVPSELMKKKETTLLQSVSRCFLASLLWPLLLTVPLLFQNKYEALWPREWYEYREERRPSPLGLSLGIFAVAVGQVFVLIYQYLRWSGSTWLGELKRIQPNAKNDTFYDYTEGLYTHLSQPEGFAMLVGYLSITWMWDMLPSTYYSFEGGIDLKRALLCLLVQDFLQYLMHRLEHVAHAAVYRASHKPHHRFTNPKLFDAFNGSLTDTILMIVIPLFATAHVVHCNVWTYMTFGSLYANWLCLIHSEFVHAWDPLFACLGFGTAADHHVHHKLFTKNYGHLFMYWDRLFFTYKDPLTVSVFKANFNTRPSSSTTSDKEKYL